MSCIIVDQYGRTVATYDYIEQAMPAMRRHGNGYRVFQDGVMLAWQASGRVFVRPDGVEPGAPAPGLAKAVEPLDLEPEDGCIE